MDRLWKHLMQLDARALFFGAVALFAVVVILVAWLSLHHAAPPSAPTAKTAEVLGANTASHDIGVLSIVSNQMAADALIVPVNPFRPSIEALVLINSGGNSGTLSNLPHGRSAKTNLFAGLRPAPNNTPGIPTFIYRGFFQRPDGIAAALFSDSTDAASHFFTPGSKIHEATLMAADMHSAKVEKPDGQTVDLAIGEAFTLPAAKP